MHSRLSRGVDMSGISGGCVRTSGCGAFCRDRGRPAEPHIASSSFGTPRIVITRFRL